MRWFYLAIIFLAVTGLSFAVLVAFERLIG
jgi:hypothetical protein